MLQRAVYYHEPCRLLLRHFEVLREGVAVELAVLPEDLLAAQAQHPVHYGLVVRSRDTADGPYPEWRVHSSRAGIDYDSASSCTSTGMPVWHRLILRRMFLWNVSISSSKLSVCQRVELCQGGTQAQRFRVVGCRPGTMEGEVMAYRRIPQRGVQGGPPPGCTRP